MLMSTSLAALGTFGAYLKSINTRYYRIDGERPPALVGLLRRLPNLRRVWWNLSSADALAEATVAGGWGGGLVELEMGYYTGAHAAAALGAAIGTGNLPSLQRIAVFSHDGGGALSEISNGLRGGASPRLTKVEGVCDNEGMVAFAEALEARMALGCRPIRRLNLRIRRYDGDVDPAAILRFCSSRALAKLKAIELGGLCQEEEVRYDST
jgi:hypothetical protein